MQNLGQRALELIRSHKKTSLLIFITLASFTTHFAFYSRQDMAVFDEIYFTTDAQDYYTHKYYFDIHPPLGKLLIAASALPQGIPADVQFKSERYTGTQPNYARLRLLPTLAGVALPIIIFLLALELGLSLVGAGFAGGAIVLENALLTQSRLVLIDSFLLLFGFGALLCFMRYIRLKGSKRGHFGWLVGSGVLVGMAIGIKWTSLVFLAFMGLLYLWRNRKVLGHTRVIWHGLVGLVIAPLAAYAIPFAVHFALLTKTGTGDAFMSPAFQHTLVGNNYASQSGYKKLSFKDKFLELNWEMFDSNKSITGGHPYGSRWYSWPLLQRPIWYYVDGKQYIYLLGNPLLWWLATIAAVVMLWRIFDEKKQRKLVNIFLAGAFLVSWLPFMLITRVMFLYHYFTALIFSILMLAVLVDQIPQKRKVVIALAVVCGLSFVFFAPLSYGLPLNEKALSWHMWLPSWR